MPQLKDLISNIFEDTIQKAVFSNPAEKDAEFKKITISRMPKFYQITKFTEKQVFHENIDFDNIAERCIELFGNGFTQIYARSQDKEYNVKIGKDGKVLYKTKNLSPDTKTDIAVNEHNRKKQYILAEGEIIEPLIDMGIFTKDGKIINSMYDKYKQINRLIEIIDDSVKQMNTKKLNVIDFGCGKSYLTFIVYYYLTEIKKIDATIIGLDLKKDVIEKCNKAAEKYGYKNLKFCLGDINGFKCPFEVDMVITLHACDTATDYALYNAINWGAKMIFSVPCCQHELNSQIKTDNLSLLTRYGIIQERFSALLTDSIRGNLLEYCGYKTQLLEFIDFSHTPKNILIRAVLRNTTPKATKEKALNEVTNVIEEFNVKPTLYKLLFDK
ncbi:MAG: SAM-dependent methyltransferase [Clostridia bacterium]|nr:SAM-dependent methyltransferase [Clostridia bacterium]MBO5433389.1 SAM-dependent methyltransferase [Clostridia bacterium]